MAHIDCDVSLDALDLCTLSSGQFSVTRVPNGPQAVADLVHKLAARPGVLVILEASGGYEAPPLEALWQAEVLVERVDPHHVRRFAEAQGEKAKSDRVDARILAEFGLCMTPEPAPDPGRGARHLKALLTRRRSLAERRKAKACHLKQARIADLREMAQEETARFKVLIRALDQWTALGFPFRRRALSTMATGGTCMTIRTKPALAAALGGLLASGPLAAQDVTLPSGHQATLFDVVLEAASGPTAPDAFTDPEGEEGEAVLSELGNDPQDAEAYPALDPPGAPLPAPPRGGLARFRLRVPGLGGEGSGFDAVAADFAWLCAELALPALRSNGWAPTEVVIALSDRETAFGALDPEAVQFFEGFRISDGACVPQAF